MYEKNFNVKLLKQNSNFYIMCCNINLPISDPCNSKFMAA